MRRLFTLLVLALPMSAQAMIEFRGSWDESRYYRTLKIIGTSTNNGGHIQITLNFDDGSQILFTKDNIPLGLSMSSYIDKCLTILPSRAKGTVSFISECAN